jgi:hypothetical protein
MYKRLLLALALFSAAPLAHAQDKAPKPSLKALDEKNGFRTRHFGDDISQFADAVVKEDDGDHKFYSLTSENLKLGDADLKEIVYGFYKGKLATVTIKTPGITESKAVLEALKAQYGTPFQSNRYMQKFSWLGKNVFLLYEENSATGAAEVYMSSKAISAQEKEDEKAAGKKAASDL